MPDSKTGMSDETAIQLVVIEMASARMKHPTWPEDNKLLGAAIVCEESGELIRAAVQFTSEGGEEAAMFREAVQTAASAIRFLAGK